VTDPAEFLPGTWRVERELEDAGLGPGHFSGCATFAPDGDGLSWVESGRMTIGRYDGPARRALRLVPDGDGWLVRFADGRPFHRLDVRDGRCALEHPCGEDRYRGEFAMCGPDAFAIDWTVSGPGKAQRLSARYERA
jgi:Family of unknown function (DUF6314)